MWFYHGKDLILKVIVHGSIYLISWIKGGTNELTLTATPSPRLKKGKHLNPRKRLSLDETRNIKYYRRLGHVGAKKLRNLHKVTKLEQRIIIPNEILLYEVYRISKMKNRMNKTLSPWKANTLALIYVDACSPLPKSLRGNIYFSQIVDN
ncbi:hypothetical protein L207DRAFT_620191, partial [Hyaloscypha variabilis F]